MPWIERWVLVINFMVAIPSRTLGFYERQGLGLRMDGSAKEEPQGFHLRMVRPGRP